MTTPGQAPVASVAEAAERSHLALRRAVVDVAMGLLHAGVLSHSGHADLSARVGPDVVLIATLSRARDLVPDDLAVVRLDGSVAEGDLGGMSTEVVAMHAEVYRARPQVGAVIHTHSPHLLAFALAGRPLPVRYEPLPRLGQAEEVPVAPPVPVAACIELIKARPGTRAVLLGGHGVLAFGPDTETTVSLLVALEEAAEAELRTAVLGRLSALPGTLHIWGMAAGKRCAMVTGYRAPGEMITLMPTHAQVPPTQRQRTGQVNDLLPLGDWIRHHSLRSWPVLLFLALICVPSIALVILGPNPSATTFDHVAWIFAAYFAVAWLLLLGAIIRPEHVTRPTLVLVTVIALATQVPLAVTLEVDLHADTAGLGPSIWSVGLPEELAKAIPVLAVAVVYRLWGRHVLTPRDYLFLGAVSGLVFGTSEVVHYFTVNGLAEFYLTVQSALPSIQQLILTGHSAPDSVFAVLIGPVRYFILDFVWRFLTDPITHACWAGLTAYFIGLAYTGRHKWYTVSWIGLVIAAILHGLNDWSRVNGSWLWVVVTIVSGILFLGYAKVGSRSDLEVPGPWPPASGRHGLPPERPPATVGGAPRPWWEH
jgi:L-fuculose-phosphate aldolase